MNPFTHSRPSRDLMPERVEIPGVDADEVEALQERFEAYTSTRRGYLLAMMFGRKPIYGGTARWKRPKKKPTKHVRQMRARKERAAYLREASA